MIQQVSIEEANGYLSQDDILLVDVRTPDEHHQARIPGDQLWVDWFQWPVLWQDAFASVDRETKILLYCRVGARSYAAAEQLVHQGFSQVMNLEGGIVAWAQAGLPLDTEPAAT